MKNVTKFALALVVFFSTIAMRANDDFSVRVKSGAGKQISFTINDTKNVHISIFSKDGVEVFDENIKSKDGKISRSYDLNALPNGTYYLETETKTRVDRREITLSGTTATVSEKTLTETYKPVMFSKDGLVTVSILNSDKTPVEIKMFDENNNELYSETVTGEQSLAKRFDINKTTAKKITFVMSYNNKTFVETVAAR